MAGNLKKKAPVRWRDTHSTKLKIRVLGNEIFLVYINQEMTIREVRELAELATGIPYDLQRLTYLDEAELVDSTTIKENEIVPGGTIDLTVWNMWQDLVEYTIEGQVNEVLKLGVSPVIPFSSPITEYLDEKAKLSWLRKRAFVALCIAAHRELLEVCEVLIPLVPNINYKTVLGRTVLHIAASQGRVDSLKLLREYGYKLKAKDKFDLTPLEYSTLFSRFPAERFLQMEAWNEKMRKKPPPKKIEPPKPPVEEPKESETAESVVGESTEPPPSERDAGVNSQGQAADVQAPSAASDLPEEKPEPKDPRSEVKSLENRLRQMSENKLLPAGYCKNPDSFKRYLLSLKNQGKWFGYAASIIDDHLQRLDDARFHTFDRKPLMSELNMEYI